MHRRIQDFRLGGTSSAEGASIEAPPKCSEILVDSYEGEMSLSGEFSGGLYGGMTGGKCPGGNVLHSCY